MTKKLNSVVDWSKNIGKVKWIGRVRFVRRK